MTGNLKLCCRKCTREGHFVAPDRQEAIKGAIDAGWVKTGADQFVCPLCPVSVNSKGELKVA